MASYRFPILILKDRLGQSTAIAVGADDQAVAVADDDSKAIDRLSDYLHWQGKRAGWLPSPDLIEPTLTTLRVPIRPEYRTMDRIYPCAETFSLVIHCVHGWQERGMYYAELPLLRTAFYYYDDGSLPELVARYAQEQLKGQTPRDIANFLSPPHVELRLMVVNIPDKRKASRPEIHASVLQQVADPIGDRTLRRQFGQAWERDAELAELTPLLFSRRQNILLVGESGVGKTTLLATAIRQLGQQSAKPPKEDAQGTGQSIPFDKRYWLTSGSRLIAGMKYLGQWEQRCERIVSELADMGGVLCVENLLDLLQAGSSEPSSSVANFLVPYAQRGELLIASECTPAELEACRRLLPGLVDLFQIVPIRAFDRRRAVAVLDRLTIQLRQQLRLDVERGATELTERLFRRFLPDQSFPGSTISFLTDAFSAKSRSVAISRTGQAAIPERPDASQSSPERQFGRTVTTGDLLQQFVWRTGLPESLLRDELTMNHAEILERFRRRVVGQTDACFTAADLVTTFKAGLNDPGRPVGTFLFCGPTGVGKTEMAKAIADEFFGHGEQRERLVRLDMSEYAGHDATHRLLTRPDGEPGRLIQTLRRQPLSVVLFDEIEKASPDVFDVLLGLLDEGRLTDLFGRVTSFRCAIVILTSNLGSERQQSIGFGDRHEVSYDRAIREFFRPEFFNRLNEVVTFHPLDSAAVRQIAQRELSALNSREGLVRRGLSMIWSEDLLNAVVTSGFDPRYGARPLQRTVERIVAGPLAHWLVTSSPVRGSVVVADWLEDEARFTLQTPLSTDAG